MNTSIKMNIPTSIGSCSCIGVNTVFPRGHGNYISTINSDGERFEIVNLSYEDLEDAINLGLVDKEMEADVYKVIDEEYTEDEEVRYVAFVTDKRFPEKCLTPEWFYNNRNYFAVEILRKKYNIKNDVCLCEDSSLHARTISWCVLGRNGYKKGNCYQCKKVIEIGTKEV